VDSEGAVSVKSKKKGMEFKRHFEKSIKEHALKLSIKDLYS